MYQLKNVIGRSNAVKSPSADFNACDDFLVTVKTGHIIAAFAEISEDFNLSEAWMDTVDNRKKLLSEICGKLMEKYLRFSFNEIYVPSEDKKLEYAIQIISLGCFYLEYSDAIREGDGIRVLRCWRYLLPIFWNSGRVNYSNEVLNMLFQHDYSLSPRHSHDLLYGRFINVHGRQGKNIPADLHMEHMDRVLKECIHDLGSNQMEQAITRVGKAMGAILPILDEYDEHNNISIPSGAHKPLNILKDQQKISMELSKHKILQYVPQRKHENFPNPRIVLHGKKKMN